MGLGLALILGALAFAAAALAAGSNRWRPWLLPLAGAVHLGLTLAVLAAPVEEAAGRWLVLDPPGRYILGVVSTVFFFCTFYTVGYLRERPDLSNRVFCACQLSALAGMSLVAWANHLGVMWVAIEASTLAAAPLIFFERTALAIEATWKYLLVGSVGIALALLGSLFLAYSSVHAGVPTTLTFDDLVAHAPLLSKPWLRAAFVLFLVGYGTKMGLAPMHTWKPDAYGEAPGAVGALLAGASTSCAFLALLRVHHVASAAGEGAWASGLLLFMGLFSMGVAAVFMIGQRDFKRTLGYSSIEHMGILALGVGVGGAALRGTLLHVLTNAVTKGVIFLAAGNIHRAYLSKSLDDVRGAMRRVPVSGPLFLVAFLAITGSPPFGPFASEYSILIGAFAAGRFGAGALFLAFLMVVFLGMGRVVLPVVFGRPPAPAMRTPYRERFLTCAPVLGLAAVSLLLGLWTPPPLDGLLADAVRYLGGPG